MIFEFFSSLILCFLISFLIIITGILNSRKKKVSGLKEIREIYECGFDSFHKNILSISIQFFNIALLYLLIDLEIALILPFFFNVFLLIRGGALSLLYIGVLFFLLILLLVLEYFLGGFDCWNRNYF